METAWGNEEGLFEECLQGNTESCTGCAHCNPPEAEGEIIFSDQPYSQKVAKLRELRAKRVVH